MSLLGSCSLRDLTRKTLFLLSLATARRVGELQAVSAEVSSSSGGDLFLSYLPEFRAKSESASNPLPRSFRVRSLHDFVGSLPGEMLLCPVRALQVYLRCTASLSSRPQSLLVSPRAPSRPMSKNALSFFLRSVISLSLLLLLLLLPLHVLTAFGESLLRLPSLVMSLSLLFLPPRLGALLLSLLLSIYVTYSSLLLQVFLWVQ